MSRKRSPSGARAPPAVTRSTSAPDWLLRELDTAKGDAEAVADVGWYWALTTLAPRLARVRLRRHDRATQLLLRAVGHELGRLLAELEVAGVSAPRRRIFKLGVIRGLADLHDERLRRVLGS
jgi:hypothetical protein